MSEWSSTRARRVLAALLRMAGSSNDNPVLTVHFSIPAGRILYSRFTDTDEIGPRMLARIAKRIGLNPEDL